MKTDNFFWLDAFSSERFGGNPAAVCLVPAWPDVDVMQGFAREVGLSETAFIKPSADYFEIRWFTPTKELGLVGHATLAAAHVVLGMLEPGRASVCFHGRDCKITARKSGDLVSIGLPKDDLVRCEPPEHLIAGLGVIPVRTFRGRHFVAELASSADVVRVQPDFARLAMLDLPTIAVTAIGGAHDYVLRFFAPANGVPEDPVSGVAQCSLAPLWADRLNKTDLTSMQLSQRRAGMRCVIHAGIVNVYGASTLILRGSHFL